MQFSTLNAEDPPDHIKRFIAEWLVELDEKIISNGLGAQGVNMENDQTGSTILAFVDKSRGHRE